MNFTEEQDHLLVMTAICHKIAAKGLPMVLKGGTALKLCYGLDRFSEDLDFDSAKKINLEATIGEAFAQIGKSREDLRNPTIDIRKNTDSVRRYRVMYGDHVNLKIETSMRGTPCDEDIVVIDGIKTYKIGKLIQQKLAALQGRTAARDLHDVIFLYEHFFDEHGAEELQQVEAIHHEQNKILDEYNAAFEEDTILSTSDLMKSMLRLEDLYQERNPADETVQSGAH